MRTSPRLCFRRRLLACPLEARAVPTVFSVTNNLDGPVTVAGQLPGSLRQAIFDANKDSNPDADVINIGAIASPISLTAGVYKVTNKNLTINGPGSGLLTINGNAASRIFEIRDNVFEGTHIQCAISGLTITNGKVTGAEMGGGMLISDEFVTLTDVAITNCLSSNGGGGICAVGFGAKLTLNNCTVSGNTSNDASATYFPSGGGFYFYGAALNVINSTITNNTSSGGGGLDTAEASGGGVAFSGDTINATATFTNCNISNNTAGVGGGIFSTNLFGSGIGMAVTFGNCSITGNKAQGNAMGTRGGAGIYLDFIGKLTVSKCLITGNQVLGKSDGSDYAQGAGLRINRLDNALDTTAGKFGVNILDSTISSNISSGGGGGLALSQSSSTTNATVLISGCVIDGNQANGKAAGKGILGGGLSFSNYNIKATVQDCQITNNTAYFGGGGIQIQGDKTFPNSLTVRNSTIAYNSTGDAANGRGAGIGAFNFGEAGNTLIVQNSTIAYNKAAGTTLISPPAAGGISVSPGTVSVGPTVKIESTILYSNTNTNGTTKADFYGAVKGIEVVNSLVSVTDSPSTIVYAVDSGNIKGTKASPANAKIDTVLALNGATTTKTLALDPTSACFNTGSNPAPALTYDQRGVGFARTSKGGTDMGAFEIQAPAAPPQVNLIQIGDGSAQRSLVKSIKVTFSEVVSFPSGITAAFDVTRLAFGGGSTGSVLLDATQSGADVTITFKSGGAVGVDPGNSLQDGKYTFTIFADKVQGAGGFLDGNKSGTYDGPAIDNKTQALHRLFGDADGNGAVNSDDFAAFRGFFGLGASIFDYNNDGSTNADDFAAFRMRFGLSGYV